MTTNTRPTPQPTTTLSMSAAALRRTTRHIRDRMVMALAYAELAQRALTGRGGAKVRELVTKMAAEVRVGFEEVRRLDLHVRKG